MERMSPLDAGFWDLETETVALHIGAVAVFDGPAPTRAEIAERYAAFVERIPRYRQRMRRVPFGLARPVWAPDERFRLTDHLYRTAVSSPGGQEQLHTLIGRLMSVPLDASRPLWEAWIVEGLAGDRWALVTKVHHSMIDGVGGMTMLAALLDQDPAAPPGPPHRQPYEPPVGIGRLLVDAALDRAGAGVTMVRAVATAPLHPARSRARAGALVRGLPRYLALARPAPATSLTGPVGASRRYRTLSVDLREVTAARAALGGSVNDVVLLLVTRGFRALLLRRGESPERHAVRCLVPVSVRGIGEEADATNRVSALVVDLPVEFGSVDTAYGAVRARMTQLKRSREAVAGELVVELAAALPAFALSAGVRAVEHLPHRVITTVATNVPGPVSSRSLLGRRMVALYPYVPIADVVRIGVAVTSYDGHLHVGITCDRAAVPDADALVAGMAEASTDLAKHAEVAR